MNRLHFFNCHFCPHVPHTRGDEPPEEITPVWMAQMFPTHVGMNRRRRELDAFDCYVPHTRGDEPLERVVDFLKEHVPHTRGDEPL